jgi:hypothetical protein
MGRTLLVLISSLGLLFVCFLVPAQPADSPEAAGVIPITGDLAPWRAYGVDAGNFDNVWIIALNNGNIVAFKRASDFQTPGVLDVRPGRETADTNADPGKFRGGRQSHALG